MRPSTASPGPRDRPVSPVPLIARDRLLTVDCRSKPHARLVETLAWSDRGLFVGGARCSRFAPRSRTRTTPSTRVASIPTTGSSQAIACPPGGLSPRGDVQCPSTPDAGLKLVSNTKVNGGKGSRAGWQATAPSTGDRQRFSPRGDLLVEGMRRQRRPWAAVSSGRGDAAAARPGQWLGLVVRSSASRYFGFRVVCRREALAARRCRLELERGRQLR